MCYIIALFICSQFAGGPTVKVPSRGPSPAPSAAYGSASQQARAEQTHHYPPTQGFTAPQVTHTPPQTQTQTLPPTSAHGGGEQWADRYSNPATAHMTPLEREQWGDRLGSLGQQQVQTKSYKSQLGRFSTTIGSMGSMGQGQGTMGPPDPPDELRIMHRPGSTRPPLTELVSYSFY